MALIPQNNRVIAILEAILAALGGASNTVFTPVNKTIPLAATEVSEAIGTSTKQLLIRARSPRNAQLQFAFVATESSTKFITIPKGNSFNIESVNINSTILYLQSDQPNTIVEILQIS
jgi:hypothetical protein